MKPNRKYKDSVFTRYFSEDPKRLIDLYNALEGKNYPEDTPVEVNTIEDVLYKDRINDLSFLLDGQLIVLVEHQSTINRNMALRMLIYLGRLYEKILPSDTMYRSTLVPLPAPKFIVLYNGEEECPEYSQQHLSAAFSDGSEPPMIDLTVDVWNVNYGKDAEEVSRSKSLNEYSFFIHSVRCEHEKEPDLAKAIKNAIRKCIQADIMKDFLTRNGSEVENMLFTEWKWDTALRVREQEGERRGEQRGEQRGGIAMLCNAVVNGMMTIANALQLSGCTEDEFSAWMKKFHPDYKI